MPDFRPGGSLTDVLPGVLGALAGPAADRAAVPGRRPDLADPALAVQQRVCVLLVDGLGWNALREHQVSAPFLSEMLGGAGSRVITSVFPTTTPIALTSFGTGLPPGEHGLTGLALRLDSGQVVNTLAIPAETDLRALQPRPTVFERAVTAGIAVTRVGPAAFDGRGLTEAALRGGEYLAAESMGERVAAAAAGAERGSTSLTYVYVGDLDAVGHRNGCRGSAWRHELAHIDRVVEQLAVALPSGTTLLVTSDHGMVDVSFENRWDVATTPALADGVATVSGDLRAVSVHARPGAQAEVLASWRATLGPAFWVLGGDEAVHSGLYGPTVTDLVRPRIGDVVAIARTDAAVVDSRTMPPAVLALIGLHGSVTEEELPVPLLAHQT